MHLDFLDLLAKRDATFKLVSVEGLDKRLQTYIADKVLEHIATFIDDAHFNSDGEFPPKSVFQSPIEQLMMLALVYTCGYRTYRLSGNAYISPQQGLVAEDEPYRVDFLILGTLEDGRQARIVVECDGHEFHEKTKEQAAKDKSRDRNLQLAGYHVFRFTGSEIWRTPDKWAAQVWEMYDRQLGLLQGRPLLSTGS